MWSWILSWPWNVSQRSLKSLKMVPFESLGVVYYSPSIITIAVSLTISEIFRMAWPWNLGLGLFKAIENGAVRWTMYDLVRHCNYSSILYNLWVIWRWKFRDLEIWLRGHSRSLKLVPFESLGAYSPFMVTMAVSVAVCEIFSVKEWCDLENRVRVRLGFVQGHWKWHHLMDRNRIRVFIRLP